MYTPDAFRQTDPDAVRRLIAERPLAQLITIARTGRLDVSLLPMLLDVDGEARRLVGHLARVNPQWSDADLDREAVATFVGPSAYVSPSWYPAKAAHGKVVPTWNYLAVEARGRLHIHQDPTWILDAVRKLTDAMEAPMAECWSVDDAPCGFIDRMLGGIVGVEVEVATIDATWKLSQNRAEADRLGVRTALSQGSESAREVAEGMAAWVLLM